MIKPRDPQRIPAMLEELRKTWEKYPDLRLGQLIEISSAMGGGGDARFGASAFYIEDDGMLEGIRKARGE